MILEIFIKGFVGLIFLLALKMGLKGRKVENHFLKRRLARSHWMPASHSNNHLPILSGIQPAELRRMGAILSLAHRESLDPDHILNGFLSGPSDARQIRLRSRRPFVPASRNLLNNLARLGIRASEWTSHK